MKRGDIWISAVLYIALGVMVLTIILAAGLPVIEKMKDQYTISQTKELMFRIDESIRYVYSQAPGAQIPLKTRISRGDIEVNQDQDTIIWTFTSKTVKSEPGIEVQEGNLIILTEETTVSNRYDIILKLNYTNYLNLITPNSLDLAGANQILIRNEGSSSDEVNISITTI